MLKNAKALLTSSFFEFLKTNSLQNRIKLIMDLQGILRNVYALFDINLL